jgi:hypothetical protein
MQTIPCQPQPGTNGQIRRDSVRNQFFVRVSVFTALAVLICAGMASSAMAQTQPTPRYVTLTPRYSGNLAAPATSTIPNWTGSLFPGGTSFTMVGTNPQTTNTTTTVTAYLIPIRLALNPTPSGIFDPAHVLPNGRSVIQNTSLSPIFNSGIDFVQGGVDLGNTQYVDAFQRGNFWSDVSGVRAALVDIGFFDAKVRQLISGNSQITPDSLPIILTYDTYLTQGGGCCIGGYHSAFGNASAPQTYSVFTYIDKPGVFAQDVSALSHEIGEWMDDPFVNTPGCGGLLENGDPLENGPNAGAFPYTLNGFTYNLQDLVFLQYFGQAPSTSVNGWWSFQNAGLSVCSNGQ